MNDHTAEKDAPNPNACAGWEPTAEPYGWCSCGAPVKRGEWIAHRQTRVIPPASGDGAA